MKKNCSRFFPALIMLTSLALCLQSAAAAAAEKTFLWKARSKTSTVYLLGSVHFLKKDVYPLNRKIEEAFEKSHALVVEADVTDMGKLNMEKLMGKAFYPQGDSLENHVSKETYELVRREFGSSGVFLELLNRQKPWMLALTLTSMELLKMGYDPYYGVDMHFLRKASSGKKRVLELESADFQIELLSGFSDREQEAFLIYTIKDLKVLSTELDNIVTAWKEGDVKGMEAMLAKSALNDQAMASVAEKLFDQRNRSMSSRIEGFLRTKDSFMVVVGAGHLIGKKGVVEMLRAKGYTVEQM